MRNGSSHVLSKDNTQSKKTSRKQSLNSQENLKPCQDYRVVPNQDSRMKQALSLPNDASQVLQSKNDTNCPEWSPKTCSSVLRLIETCGPFTCDYVDIPPIQEEYVTLEEGQICCDPGYGDPCCPDPCCPDPCYQNPRYQDPCYQDPCYQDPCYQDPCYQDPCCPDPCCPDPCGQDPCYPDPYVEDPCLPYYSSEGLNFHKVQRTKSGKVTIVDDKEANTKEFVAGQGSGQRQNQGPGQHQNQGSGQRQIQGPVQHQNQDSGQRQNHGPGQHQNHGPGQHQNQGSGQGLGPGAERGVHIVSSKRSIEIERRNLGLQAGGDSLPIWVSPSRTIGDVERELLEIHNSLLNTPNRKLMEIIEQISDLEIIVRTILDKNTGMFEKYAEAYKLQDVVISDLARTTTSEIHSRIGDEERRAQEAISKNNALKTEIKLIESEIKALGVALIRKTKGMTDTKKVKA